MMANHVTVLLHQVEGPVNLGAICRVMANFGFEKLRWTGALQANHPLAQRFAVHAGALLAKGERVNDLRALTGGCHAVFGFTPRDPAPDGRGLDVDGFIEAVREALAAGRQIGLLFGNEAHGLSNDDLVHCHHRVHLPTSATYESMNLAMAVAVVLWELRRHLADAPVCGQVDADLATPDEIAHLVDNVLAFTETFDLLNPQNTDHIGRELVQLFKTRDWRKRELQLLHMLLAKPQSRYRALERQLDEGGED